MKILAKQNRDLVLINKQNTQNENDAEKILLQVPEQYEDFNKKIVFNTKDGNIWDIIVNNEYLIPKAITKYEQVNFYIWLTKGDIDFRSKTYTLNFYPNEDASDEITTEEIGGVNTVINLLEAEITKVENIDITTEKSGDTATITITDKDGQSTSVEISDGDKGDKGDTGEPGYTPQKLIDYWTVEEQADIVSTATSNVQNNITPTITQIQSNASNALNTANLANTTANTAKSIAEGANQALSYANYQAMVTAFNSLDDDVYRVGQNVMIITLNVPDLWVSSIESTSASYTYTNDEAITTALSTNGYIQIGYYKLSALETQKVDLTDYYTKTGTENKIEDYLYQIMPTDSTSGAIATINDATTMFNAIDVSGTIKPVQDLHGYDNPWSAGGGKNLFDKTATDTDNGYVAGKYIGDNDELVPSANYNVSEYVVIRPSTTYTLSGISGVNPSFAFYNSEKQYISGEKYNGNTSITFTTPDNAGYTRMSISIANIDVLQLELGSTATAYAPYSNVCPITGWTGMKVTRTGKNLANMFNDGKIPSISNGQLVTSNGVRSDYIPMYGDAQITFSGNTSSTLYCFFYDSGKNFISWIANVSPVSAATPSNTAYIMLRADASATSLQLEFGSTATTYEPYQNTTYPISWQTEAGTVYSGNVDVTTGLLTVTHTLYTFDGSSDEQWEYYTVAQGELFRTNIPERKSGDLLTTATTICDSYKVSKQSARANGTVSGTGKSIDFINNNYSTTTAWKDNLAEHPVNIVCELNTPSTYQLTPQQISFLLGTNNLWVDTGDINVTYKADIQKYIDKKTN